MSDNLNNNLFLLQKMQENMEKLSRAVESLGSAKSEPSSDRESLKAEILREMGVDPNELAKKKKYEEWKEMRKSYISELKASVDQKVKEKEAEKPAEEKKRKWLR